MKNFIYFPDFRFKTVLFLLKEHRYIKIVVSKVMLVPKMALDYDKQLKGSLKLIYY